MAMSNDPWARGWNGPVSDVSSDEASEPGEERKAGYGPEEERCS